MRTVLNFVAVAGLVACGSLAMAQSEQDHAAHHPAVVSAPASAAKSTTPKAAPKPAAKASAPTPVQVETVMKSMQEMHDKMMAAKTSDERQALMADHMKTMQEGMAMMGQMQGSTGMGGGMPMNPDMMGRRMDMMQMMMQMMMDRQALQAPASK